jgi:MoaA/NifB/PqqE/SkfB family radical SAM enzyme
MNERIKELADQAELTIRTSTGTYMSHPEFNKKFAELIVAECLVTLDSIVCDTSGERDTLWVARKVVADHFGVE